MKHKKVEIMDSTLRDGEQTSGVSFIPHEKLVLARRLLRDVNVDRIEIASARVSEGEKEAVAMVCRYAKDADVLDFYQYGYEMPRKEQQNRLEKLLGHKVDS